MKSTIPDLRWLDEEAAKAEHAKEQRDREWRQLLPALYKDDLRFFEAYYRKFRADLADVIAAERQRIA